MYGEPSNYQELLKRYDKQQKWKDSVLPPTKIQKMAREIAECYANNLSKGSRDIQDEYCITRTCFYNLLEVAVTMNLVSDKTVAAMEKRAISNQQVYAKRAGKTSIQRYNKLRKVRLANLAKLYVEEDSSLQEIAKALKREYKELNKALQKAVQNPHLCDDELFEKVIAKLRKVNSNPGFDVDQYASRLRATRIAKKENPHF